MTDGFRSDWLGMVRGRRLPGVIWRGAFEIELWRGVVPGDHCYRFAEEAGCDVSPMQPGDRILIPHLHFVVASKTLDPAGLKAALSRWNAPWQTRVDEIWPENRQPYDVSIGKLSEYPTKTVLRYKVGGFEGQKSEYKDPYEIIWSRVINSLYNGWSRDFRNSD